MDSTKLETRVDQLSLDQTALTRNVDRVTYMVESNEKDRVEDRLLVKEIANVLKSLDKRMDAMDGLHKELGSCKEDVRLARHDIADVKSAQAAIPLMDKQLAELKVKVENLETLKARLEGGAFVITTGAKIFYAFIGIGGVSIIGLLVHFFFGVDVQVDNVDQ